MTTLDPKALEAATAEWLNWTDRTAGEGLSEHLARSVAAYLDALSTIPEQGAGVKPLEWQRENVDGTFWIGYAPVAGLGEYRVKFDGEKWEAIRGMVLIGTAATADGAKAIGDSDYEARIRSALVAPSQPAAVGVTDEMVEAACKAYAEHRYNGTAKWPDDFANDYPEKTRKGFKVALEAALRSTS